ncbi:hypothetical protein C7S18_15865 [Ahniella affigens]|uniref:Uncharacterized protein n=2 Tax=Ahniella affigens TaxID=2021234 RepID=A0A2P1PUS2_9GAMM|nr:hypothetical protein C7S18_15865 [Ahniella affigens]
MDRNEVLSRTFHSLVKLRESNLQVRGLAVRSSAPSIVHMAPGFQSNLHSRVRTLLLARDPVRFSKMLSDEPIRLNFGLGGFEQIRLPLYDRTSGRAGDIINAYSTVDSVAKHLLRTLRNMVLLKSAEPQLNLRTFVLRPLSVGKHKEDIDNEIKLTSSALRAQQVDVEMVDSADELADAVVRWSKVA